MRAWISFVFAAIFMVCSAIGHAQTFPALSGRVVDQANLLDPAQEAAITAKLETLETQSRRQMVVATVSSLEGYDEEDYGYRLGRFWGIGSKERNDGLLLLVAPNDRRVSIEVGYGLEPILPDVLAHRIVQNVILPQFRANNYPAGITAGVDATIQQLQLPPEEAIKLAAEAKNDNKRASKDSGINISGILFWIFIFIFIILPILRSFGRQGGRKHRGSGVGPVIIWGGNDWGGGGGSSWGGGFGGGGGFSGGGGSFGGGGASGGW
jgi:uncharacterized protein